MKNIFFLIFCSLVLLYSCEKDADNIPLPEGKSKLVVGCFISTQDTQVQLTLTKSNPVFGPEHNKENNGPVTNATATISDGSHTISLMYNATTEKYISATPLTITAGKTYNIEVSTPDGNKVTATCTVPANNITSAQIDFDTLESGNIFIKWTDLPGEKNYYRTSIHRTIFDASKNDTVYHNFYVNGDDLSNDIDRDGNSFSNKYYYYTFYDDSSTPLFYDFYILNIDEQYYKYQKSVNNYTNDNPFSEPTPIYSNINGGLGIFCAYQQYHMRIPI